MNKKERILVTGANGQLGFDVLRELRERGYNNVRGIDVGELDITNEIAVHKYIFEYKPRIIIHNAAFTAVDKAEDMEELCYAVNVLGTKYLVKEAKAIHAKIVYISTDYVFAGNGSEFHEVNDPKEPLSVYGKTKYQGEEMVEMYRKHFIVRISWAFGINGNNFIKTMLRLAETKKEINVVHDQIGSPTYTYDLSKLLCDMIETKKYGVYHATNEGVCSWNEFARFIFKTANIAINVNQIETKDYPTKAIRPLNSRMSKKTLDRNGFSRLPSWQDATSRFIHNELKK